MANVFMFASQAFGAMRRSRRRRPKPLVLLRPPANLHFQGSTLRQRLFSFTCFIFVVFFSRMPVRLFFVPAIVGFQLKLL